MPKPTPGLLRHGWCTLGLLTTTIIWGAFVAGLRAGLAYNTWPLMDVSFLPPEAWNLQPQWINLLENTALVQFVHRWLAPTTLLMILAWVGRSWKNADASRKPWLKALGIMGITQVVLGLSTLLSHVQIVIAVAHQAGAIILLSLMLINLRYFYDTKTPSK